MDIAIIIIMGVLLSDVMKMHGTWKPLQGFDFIGWGMACFFLLILVRIPIYLAVYGFHFPFHPSEWMQLGTGVFAIAFWYAALYYRWGKLIMNIKFKR